MPSAKKSLITLTRKPLQDSTSVDSSKRPEPLVKSAAWVIYFIGIFNLVLGLAALVLRLDLLQQLGVGSITMISGLVIIALGYFVMKKSLAALLITMALVALSTVSYVITITRLGFQPNLYAVVIRIALLVPMYRAIAPLRNKVS